MIHLPLVIFFGAWYFMFFAFNPLHTFLIDGYAPTAQPDADIPGIPVCTVYQCIHHA